MKGARCTAICDGSACKLLYLLCKNAGLEGFVNVVIVVSLFNYERKNGGSCTGRSSSTDAKMQLHAEVCGCVDLLQFMEKSL